MRVLWLTHMSSLGGADLAVSEAVSAMRTLGHSVHVVLPFEGPLRTQLGDAARVDILHSNRWAGQRPLPPLATRVRQLGFNVLRAAPRIAALAKTTAADLVVTNTLNIPAGALAARRAGVSHVWYVHEFGELDHGIAFHWGEALSLRVMSALSARVLVNSEALKRHYARGMPSAKIRIARYSVEVPDIDTDSGAPHNPFRLILLGEKKDGKGQLEAIRAVSRLTEKGVPTELDLVGGGDPRYENELRREVTNLGLESRVHFVAFDPERLQRLARADVALMCSRSEAFGRVTVEAMKLGKPVVGANAGATPELVRDGETGLLYAPGDADDLAAKLTTLYREPHRLRAMGERGRQWARSEFTVQHFATALAEAFQEALPPV